MCHPMCSCAVPSTASVFVEKPAKANFFHTLPPISWLADPRWEKLRHSSSRAAVRQPLRMHLLLFVARGKCTLIIMMSGGRRGKPKDFFVLNVLRDLLRPDLAFSLWCGTKRLGREGRDWPARPAGHRAEENLSGRNSPQNASKLSFDRGIGGWCLDKELQSDQATTLPFSHRLSSAGVVIWGGFVLSAAPFETGLRRGPLGGPAECGGAVLHTVSPTPVASLLYCVTCHALSLSQMRSRFLHFFSLAFLFLLTVTTWQFRAVASWSFWSSESNDSDVSRPYLQPVFILVSCRDSDGCCIRIP